MVGGQAPGQIPSLEKVEIMFIVDFYTLIFLLWL